MLDFVETKEVGIMIVAQVPGVGDVHKHSVLLLKMQCGRQVAV